MQPLFVAVFLLPALFSEEVFPLQHDDASWSLVSLSLDVNTVKYLLKRSCFPFRPLHADGYRDVRTATVPAEKRSTTTRPPANASADACGINFLETICSHFFLWTIERVVTVPAFSVTKVFHHVEHVLDVANIHEVSWRARCTESRRNAPERS